MKDINNQPLTGFKLAGRVLYECGLLLVSYPSILIFFVLETLYHTASYLFFNTVFLKPYFPSYEASASFLQIDNIISNYGDFLKNLITGLIPLQLFTVETARNIVNFFGNTVVAVCLGRYLEQIHEKKKRSIGAALRLEKNLYAKIALWTLIFHVIFLVTTYLLDITLSYTFFHHVYYALSYTITALLIFYINPILAFEDKPLFRMIKNLFIMMDKTRLANISWVLMATVWFYFFGSPKTQISIADLTALSAFMLFFKKVISPMAAILWYWHIIEEY